MIDDRRLVIGHLFKRYCFATCTSQEGRATAMVGGMTPVPLPCAPCVPCVGGPGGVCVQATVPLWGIHGGCRSSSHPPPTASPLERSSPHRPHGEGEGPHAVCSLLLWCLYPSPSPLMHTGWLQISEALKPPAVVTAVPKRIAFFAPTWQIVPTKDIVDSAYRVPEKREEVSPSLARGEAIHRVR